MAVGASGLERQLYAGQTAPGIEAHMLTRVLDLSETVGMICIDEWNSSGGFLSTKWLVSSCVGVALLLTEGEPGLVLLVIGALANALGGKLVKRWLAQPRPGGSRLSDPGMPSSHALSLFFISAFAATDCLRSINGGSGHPPPLLRLWSSLLEGEARVLPVAWAGGGLSVLPAAAPAVLLLGGAAALAALRVRAGLHTSAQVAVGAALGMVGGCAWSLAVEMSLKASLARALHPWGARINM